MGSGITQKELEGRYVLVGPLEGDFVATRVDVVCVGFCVGRGICVETFVLHVVVLQYHKISKISLIII